MVLDSCLGLMLAAVGLRLAERRSLWLVRPIAVCLLALGSANLVIRASGGAFTHFVFPRLAAGYMAVATAVIVRLLSIGLLLASRVQLSRPVFWMLAALGTLVFRIRVCRTKRLRVGPECCSRVRQPCPEDESPDGCGRLCSGSGLGGILRPAGESRSRSAFRRVYGVGDLCLAASAVGC
jgi:hypothetical protein